MSTQPAIFLDRDGVINENRAEHVKTIAEVRFVPGALAALAALARGPRPIVIVTNQAQIGRGLVTRAAIDQVNAYILTQIAAAGGRVDALYLCPHAPHAACLCRKPQPGMLLQAARELNLDLPASVLVGDSLTDLQAARTAGARPVLVLTGRGPDSLSELAAAGLQDAAIFADLAAAVAAGL